MSHSKESTSREVTLVELRDAIEHFVLAWVRKNKRERVTMLLLTRPHERSATLQGLPEWLTPGAGSELPGELTKLATRVGDLPGIVVDHDGARYTTLRVADEYTQWGSLFLSVDRRITLLFAEIGPPVLCEVPLR